MADRFSDFDEDLKVSDVYLSESQFRFEFSKSADKLRIII